MSSLFRCNVIVFLTLVLSQFTLGILTEGYFLIEYGVQDPRTVQDFYQTRGCMSADGKLVGFTQCSKFRAMRVKGDLITLQSISTTPDGHRNLGPYLTVDGRTKTLRASSTMPSKPNLVLTLESNFLLSYAPDYPKRTFPEAQPRFYFNTMPRRGRPGVVLHAPTTKDLAPAKYPAMVVWIEQIHTRGIDKPFDLP
ncbi:MAG: hypothetical protein M1816_001306 [Peltula sp. TS41687]|nr:MAG: hypothetical protein M1816_001306 [Peltula sp. TS41687]